MLRIFIGRYDWYCRGPAEQATLVIVANTESEALGMALNAVPRSSASEWTITEFNASEAGATVVHWWES